MARSSARASPYVVEIQRHYLLSKDEGERKGKRHRLPSASRSPSVRSYTNKSRVSNETDMGVMMKARHVPMGPSQLNRGSLEYEDIYNERNHSRETSHLKQYGRYSFRDDSGYGRYGKVRGYTRDSRRSLRAAHGTQMRIPNGEIGHVNAENMDRKDVTDTIYLNRTVRDRNGDPRSTEIKGGHKGATRPKRVAKDNDDSSRDDLELWIARQTSFPRNVKQNRNVELSSQKIPRNNQNALSHNAVSVQGHSVRDKSWKERQPPAVAAKPSLPMPRSASPASSVRSIQSAASSHVSQHSAKSAASEVSVKSILKKPKVGRVVLKEEPASYTLCAVLSCILCFPFGIYALAKSKRVNEAVEENDYETALSSSRKVKHFCIGVLLVYIGILAVVGALLAVYFTTGKIF